MGFSNSLTAIIADAQPLTAAGVGSVLAEKHGISVIANISSSAELVSAVEKEKPDLLIADYNLPGYIGLADIKEAMGRSSKTNVLILSADNNKVSILDALQLGVKGYITKDCSLEEVGMAIQSTVKGEKFFCHKILDIVMEKHFSADVSNESPALTVRESEILTLIAHGHSTQAIADKLFLSPHTVQTHRKSIIKKLNIKSPTQFVIYAMDLGLLKIR
jgi:DNA-binding NarL/FixJ family response regulator